MRVLPVTLAAVLLAAAPAYATHDNGKGRGHQGQGSKGTVSAPPAEDFCTGNPDAVRALSTTVDGGTAQALYAVPRKKPRGIVVFDHGYGHTMYSWSKHLSRTAEQLYMVWP